MAFVEVTSAYLDTANTLPQIGSHATGAGTLVIGYDKCLNGRQDVATDASLRLSRIVHYDLVGRQSSNDR